MSRAQKTYANSVTVCAIYHLGKSSNHTKCFLINAHTCMQRYRKWTPKFILVIGPWDAERVGLGWWEWDIN